MILRVYALSEYSQMLERFIADFTDMTIQYRIFVEIHTYRFVVYQN